MAKRTKIECKALRLLRSRVLRFRNAGFALPGLESESATAAIREATSLYIESWVVPLIDALERGDTRRLQSLTRGSEGEPASPKKL